MLRSPCVSEANAQASAADVLKASDHGGSDRATTIWPRLEDLQELRDLLGPATFALSPCATQIYTELVLFLFTEVRTPVLNGSGFCFLLHHQL